MRRTAIALTLAAIVIVGIVTTATLSGFLVDWLWFDTLGFSAVFATTWRAKVVVFAVAAAGAALVVGASGFVAARATVPHVRRLRIVRGNGGLDRMPEVLDLSLDGVPWGLVIGATTVLLALLVGLGHAGNWAVLLKWMHAVPFDRPDPVFGRDLGFYVFSLPVYERLRDWAMLLIFLAGALAGGVYWARGAIEAGSDGVPRLTPGVLRHLSVLLALFFLVKAGDYVLQRYGLLFSDNGVVFGAAYTDVHLRLPMLTGLVVLAVVAAVLCAANVVLRDFRLLLAAVVLVLGASLLEGIVPSLFQSYRVKPDELRLESPYITHNIALTRFGFGLERIVSQEFPAEGTLTPAVLADNQVTIQNIRWWDPRPLRETYRQLQEIRLYYDFHDVDVDRYFVEGRYQQVMLSARELNQDRLPPDAQTWINQRFKFTHGIGLAMSPVDRFDKEGLPVFYVRDIPPVSPVGLRIDRPQIYYGEKADGYVVVGGGTLEFDYPKGQENVYTTFEGRGGVALESLWRRVLFAWHFGDVKLLLSGNVTPSSRMLFRRLIQDRVNRIAPFLRLDRDPYVVVSDGRLLWIQDAYTTSDRLPYSQHSRATRISYIRNSVKIVTDAYDGAVTFYVADTTDPIVRTYQRIFPTLFQPIAAMPPALRQHVRYPEDLFILQAHMYAVYHMTNPEVFYNKEDQWSFPQETVSGQAVTMEPYYTIMRLPGEPREEFILMLPMVPNNRDNMIAWLAARCDGDQYGTLIEYAFPKEKLIYGPAQIEARIDQDTTISQQLSLWNQIGSRVIRGNLLVIPIDDALLYVEPLYLSAEKRELPELKRMIASSGGRVAMSHDVESLLAALVGPEASGGELAPSAPSTAQVGTPVAPATEALTHYRRALEALRNNDWPTFGIEMDTLHKALESAAAPPS